MKQFRILAMTSVIFKTTTLCRCETDGDHNIIVFGASTVGKTTICNRITGQNHRTGSVLRGTMLSKLQEYKPIFIRNKRVKFIDTAGLNGSTQSVVSAEAALSNLVNLSAVIKEKKGLSLILMVKGENGPMKYEEDNIKLMRELFPRTKIVLVVNKVTKKSDESQELVYDQCLHFKTDEYCLIGRDGLFWNDSLGLEELKNIIDENCNIEDYSSKVDINKLSKVIVEVIVYYFPSITNEQKKHLELFATSLLIKVF